MSAGSLGQGLSVAIGAACAKKLNGDDHQVYSLNGDGELQEGQIWEAAMYAAHVKADTLTAIIDYNKYQESGAISLELALEPFADKWRAFGWHAEEVDGHDIGALLQALQSVQQAESKPQVIIAHTVKGKGVSFVEADYRFHGKALTPEQADKAREEIQCS